MKKCPKCKSPLAKSSSKNMTCVACGFTVITLQISTDHEDYSIKKFQGPKTLNKQEQSEVEPQQEQNPVILIKALLLSYQKLLMNCTKQFMKTNKLDYQFELKVRELWLQYLQKINKSKLKISGAFSKFVQPKIKKEKPQQKEEKKKRGRPKKSQFSKKLQSSEEEQQQQRKETFKQKCNALKKRNDKNLNQIKEELLQIIYESQCKDENLTYIVEKYVSLLISTRGHTEANHQLSSIKNNKIKITLHELKKLGEIRSHKYTKKLQLQYVIVLEDLLNLWAYENLQNYKQSFDQLMMEYRSPANTMKKPIIDRLISELQTMATVEDEEEYPSLSFSLIYALFNVGCLQLKLTLSIDQIIKSCSKLALTLNDVLIQNNEHITPTKIRLLSSQLLEFMNVGEMYPCVHVNEWIRKYCNAFGISSHTIYVERLCYPLMHFRSEKKLHLYQDIIAKCMIMIYVKLSFSFDCYPFLSGFPLEAIQSKLQQQEQQLLIKLKQKLSQTKQLNMLKFNKALKIYNQKKKKIKRIDGHCLHNYASLNHLSSIQLKELFHDPKSEIKLPIPTHKPHPHKQPTITTNPHQTYHLTQKVLNQLCVLNDEDYQLDLAADNYEFLYAYQNQVSVVDRNGFVHIAENMVAKECKMKEFYEELETLQRILMMFQR